MFTAKQIKDIAEAYHKKYISKAQALKDLAQKYHTTQATIMDIVSSVKRSL